MNFEDYANLPGLYDLLDEDELDAEETVGSFLESWSEGNYETAYGMLANDSAIREGLSQEEWVERREAWARQAHPGQPSINVVYDFERMEDGTLRQEVEAFFSLELATSDLSVLIKELPASTISYAETGRQWFWARYTVTRENDEDEWQIHGMYDLGTAALQLPVTELQRHMNDITENVKALGKKIGIEDIDNFDPESLENIDEEELSEDFLGDMSEFFQEISWTTTRGLHYCDALIHQTPQDRTPYERAAGTAMIATDMERAAEYFQLLAERFPEQQGEVLRGLAIVMSRLVDEFDREEMPERAVRFAQLVEKTLRDSIAVENVTEGYTLLAGALLSEGNRQAEAEEALRQGQTLIKNIQDEILVEEGFGRLAAERTQHKEALRHYQRVGQLDPKVPGIWADIGHEQRLLKDYAAAQRSLERSIKQDPDITRANVDLALIHIDNNQIRKARELLEEVLDISPEDAELVAALSLTYIRSGDLQTAEELLEEAEEIDELEDLVRAVRAELEIKKEQRRAKQAQNRAKAKPRPKPKRR